MVTGIATLNSGLLLIQLNRLLTIMSPYEMFKHFTNLT